MLGIPREVIDHALRLHRFDDERRMAIGEEVAKLLETRFIKEVYHSDWLANPVLVKKKTGKCRMFVDYTGLNKGELANR